MAHALHAHKNSAPPLHNAEDKNTPEYTSFVKGFAESLLANLPREAQVEVLEVLLRLLADSGRRSLHQAGSGYEVTVRSKVTLPPDFTAEQVTSSVTQLQSTISTRGVDAFPSTFVQSFGVLEVKEAKDITADVKAGTVVVQGVNDAKTLDIMASVNAATAPPPAVLNQGIPAAAPPLRESYDDEEDKKRVALGVGLGLGLGAAVLIMAVVALMVMKRRSSSVAPAPGQESNP